MSWGRTLELSTVASPDVCDWLETTTSPRTTSAGASRSRTYDLLLTWSAQGLGQRRGEAPPTANTVRNCQPASVSTAGSASATQQMFGFIPRRRPGSAARRSSLLSWSRRRICAQRFRGRDGKTEGKSGPPLRPDGVMIALRA